MVNVYVHGPEWFFGTDAVLVAFSALIAFCVVLAASRLYRMTEERRYAFFTACFVLLTLSFLFRALTDSLLQKVFFEIPAHLTALVFFYGYVVSILLALTAYLILLIVTHKLKDKRIIALLFLILVPSMLLSGSYYLSFYGLSAIFLAFISASYFQNYKKVRSFASCSVFIAFLLLTLAQVQFLLEAVRISFYVSAHITQAAGFLLILIALIKTLIK